MVLSITPGTSGSCASALHSQACNLSTARRQARRRRTRVVALGTALVALASSGTAAAAPAKAASKVVNITWQTMWSGDTIQLLDQMVSEFNAAHPGIHVTEQNIPAGTGDAKLESEIAAGDPPDVFTEWNEVLGQYAQNGDIQPMNEYLKDSYSGFEKWEYPSALQTGLYKGKLYGVPMALNLYALYYNKSMLKAAGVKNPPTTLSQLYKDQAKEWVIKGNKLEDIGFYPMYYQDGFEFYGPYFNATNCFTKAGKYNFENCKGAKQEANWLASYNNYPYSLVSSLYTALGQVSGGNGDPFEAGKEGFDLTGMWEAVQTIPDTNPKMDHNFGIEPVPSPAGKDASLVLGLDNIIPKGASNPSAAFTFITWLAGYKDTTFRATMDTKGGWVPVSPKVTQSAPYQNWLKAHPELKVFVQEEASPTSQAIRLTPTEAEFTVAEEAATQGIAQKSMTPAQALQYIDQRSNSNVGG